MIGTLIGLERLSDYLAWRVPTFQRATESLPVILVEDGRLLPEVMAKEHITADEILEAARGTRGLERMDQIKWAVLETRGASASSRKRGHFQT